MGFDIIEALDTCREEFDPDATITIHRDNIGIHMDISFDGVMFSECVTKQDEGELVTSSILHYLFDSVMSKINYEHFGIED